MTTVALPLSVGGMTISLSLRRLWIAWWCLPFRLSFGGLDGLMMELTSSLSCWAVTSLRWEAVASVAAMRSSVGIYLGPTAKFNPRASTSFCEGSFTDVLFLSRVSYLYWLRKIFGSK